MRARSEATQDRHCVPKRGGRMDVLAIIERPVILWPILEQLGLPTLAPSFRAPPYRPTSSPASPPREWPYAPRLDLPVRRTQTGDLPVPNHVSGYQRPGGRVCPGTPLLAPGPAGFPLTRQSAISNVPATVGFPLGAVPGSAVSAVPRPRSFAAAGRAPFPASYRVLSEDTGIGSLSRRVGLCQGLLESLAACRTQINYIQ
jgi:hypothetical protein